MIAAYVFTRFGERVARVASPLRLARSIAIAGRRAARRTTEESLRVPPLRSTGRASGRSTIARGSGCAFALIALASLASPRWWQILLDNPPLRFLATISYNLYLYHQVVARELLVHHFPPYSRDPHDDSRWQVGYTEAAFAFTIAQAALVTYCFERPLLRLKDPPRLRESR